MALIGWKQFAQSFLRSAVEKQVPVTQAIKLLRATGLGFRRTDMLKIYRTYSRIPTVRDLYKYIPKKYRIPTKMFATAHPFQSKQFLYEGVFRLRNLETGEVFNKYVRLSSEKWLTPNLIFSKSIDICEEGFKRYRWEITDFAITGAFAEAEDLY